MFILFVTRSKAVADGAALFALDHRVKARISKFTYGVSCKRPYNPEDPSHVKRSHEAMEGPDGRRYLRRGFDIILPRVRHRYLLLGRVER